MESDRSEDIPLLAAHFLERYAREMGREDVTLDPAVPELLSSYPWPGNVRELQNVIKRMLAMTTGNFLGVKELPTEISGAKKNLPDDSPLGYFDVRDQYLAAFERRYLSGLLESNGGDVTSAAADADVPRGTFYRLLNKHGLTPAEFRV